MQKPWGRREHDTGGNLKAKGQWKGRASEEEDECDVESGGEGRQTA